MNPPNALSRAVAAALRLPVLAYRYGVSPLLPPACRYAPSCSEYALEALSRHGALAGTALAAWRVCRCHPFAAGGCDPVPEVFSLRRPGRWPARAPDPSLPAE